MSGAPPAGDPGRDAARLEEGVARLWTRFRPALVARVEVLERASDAMRGGGLDEALRREAEREAHRLAGAAGTFGLGEVSSLAREVEERLAGEGPLSPVDAARVGAWVEAIRARMDAAPPGT